MNHKIERMLQEYADEFYFKGGEPNTTLESIERMNVCRECRTDPEWWKTGEDPNTVDSYVCPKCGKRHSVFWHNDATHPTAL